MKTTKDELWEFGKRTEKLQTFLEETKGIWQDEAARTMRTKFLVPQREHAEKAQAAFRQQEEDLQQASTLCHDAEAHPRKLESLHQSVEKAMQVAEQDMKEAQQHSKNALGVRDEAHALFKQIEQAIDDANGACS